MTHLLPEVRFLAKSDDDVRILALARDRWIDYPRATQAFKLLDWMVKIPPRQRMPCVLLYGDSNIGKTKVIAKFERRHTPEYDEEKGVEHRKIVSMQMPPTPDQSRFYTSLLFELGAPFNAAAKLSVLEKLSREVLREISPRMLVVDEVHHLLAGSYREQRASLNLLKFLANDLQMTIVLVGTQDAEFALQTDSQMSSRFARFVMPRWQESEAFRGLLAAFERILPFAVGAVFTLARFSEAFLVLRAQHLGLPLFLVPVVLVAMNLVYSIAAYPFGKLADRYSHTKLLVWGLVVLIAADVVLAMGAHWSVALGGVLLWGLHMGMTQGLLATMVADTAPADLRGTAFGVFNLASGLALLIASALAGWLWDRFGAAFTFYGGAIFSGVTICLILTATFDRKR
ncbi:MFS transporter [Cupriavidus pinatubonensis]|uniref:MFS transporter n=1 Tax=Cupriavidus pinatubonensis TaxID=248026 RepID=UPI001FD4E954|nr:MFS transporter [Cupriavidus pinatubonensis]